MKPTEDQFTTYQKLFDHFNERLFNNKLGGVILNFSRKNNTHGFFAPERWENKVKVRSHEISLNPQTLEREPIEVLATLVHEMVHLWQQDFGKPSRTTYHNKQWAKKMEEIGLMPSSTGEPGGKKTGQSMTHYIIDGGKFEKAYKELPNELTLPFIAREFYVHKTNSGEEGEEEEGGEEEKPKKSKYKYTCPSCSSNAWGKDGLNLECMDCKKQMLKEE